MSGDVRLEMELTYQILGKIFGNAYACLKWKLIG